MYFCFVSKPTKWAGSFQKKTDLCQFFHSPFFSFIKIRRRIMYISVFCPYKAFLAKSAVIFFQLKQGYNEPNESSVVC